MTAENDTYSPDPQRCDRESFSLSTAIIYTDVDLFVDFLQMLVFRILYDVLALL